MMKKGFGKGFCSGILVAALTVGLGETVACYGLGGLLLWRLDKSNALQRYLQNR